MDTNRASTLKKSPPPADNSNMTKPSEQEISELDKELIKLTGFIAEYIDKSEFEIKGLTFALDVTDVFAWVLGKISTDRFRSDAYLNLDRLKEMSETIEKRTGQKLQDYK